MPNSALRYSPVQYARIEQTPGASVEADTFSGTNRPEPYAIRASAKNDLPIRYIKDTPLKSTRHHAMGANVFYTGGNVLNETFFYPEPIVLRPAPPIAQPRFIVLQKWEGIVQSVSSESFIARLTNQTDAGPDQDAEFAKEEIDLPDHALIQPGAVFYWILGYSDSPGGQRVRISCLRFRRLPAWNKKDLDAARTEARKLITAIDWQ